jgi:hypothetical protein
MNRLHRDMMAGIIAAVFLIAGAVAPSHAQPAATCDQSLWDHVYRGQFATAGDRLRVIQPCVTVTGTIVNARPEPDGDFHIRVALDPPYRSMLNAKNMSGQNGYLVVEPVCENPVHQRDTSAEGVCNGFSQHVFTMAMVGRHVRITGAYVTDMDHGWNEIHPVSSIVPE